jgi:hypothetical protein
MTSAENGWVIEPTMPRDWPSAVRHLNATFFHTPISIPISMRSGEALFASYRRGGSIEAIALSGVTTCRLGSGRHAIMATPPAVGASLAYCDAVDSLAAALRRHGVAELVIESFGAVEHVPIGQRPGRLRAEHLVRINEREPQQIAATFSQNHRKYLKGSNKANWELRQLVGGEAHAALNTVQQAAAARAQERGEDMGVAALPKTAECVRFEPSQPWGLSCFAAVENDVVLSVALVGWCNSTGYDLISGSTPDGYKRRAAFWLQWQIICALAAGGYDVYNMGGTGQVEEDPNAPGHGLFQYKRGFGSETILCRGGSWTFRRGHMMLHRALSAIQRS